DHLASPRRTNANLSPKLFANRHYCNGSHRYLGARCKIATRQKERPVYRRGRPEHGTWLLRRSSQDSEPGSAGIARHSVCPLILPVSLLRTISRLVDD